jgi:hypothetical protein
MDHSIQSPEKLTLILHVFIAIFWTVRRSNDNVFGRKFDRATLDLDSERVPIENPQEDVESHMRSAEIIQEHDSLVRVAIPPPERTTRYPNVRDIEPIKHTTRLTNTRWSPNPLGSRLKLSGGFVHKGEDTPRILNVDMRVFPLESSKLTVLLVLPEH